MSEHEVRQNLLQEESDRVSDADIRRFLKARKNDVIQATEMIKAWYVFRKSPIVHNGHLTPDNCLDSADPYEDIYRELLPHSNCGYDVKGRPCYFEKTGLISCRFRDVINKEGMSSDRLVERHVQQQEMMMRRIEHASAESSEGISKQVVVFDLKNLSFALDFEAIDVFKRTIQIDQDFYPERLQYFFMLNSPIFFSAIWAIIKPFVDPVTVDKFKILGSDFEETLFEFIDPSVVPKELGGSNESFQWEFPGNLPKCEELGIPVGERQCVQGKITLTDTAKTAHHFQSVSVSVEPADINSSKNSSTSTSTTIFSLSYWLNRGPASSK